MARWQDVSDAERKLRHAEAVRDEAARDVERLRDFIRESGQTNRYLEWYARRLGINLTCEKLEEEQNAPR